VVGAAGGDPSGARTGAYVLGTDLSVDGHYRSDLVISTSTPVIDVSMYQRVHLQYWRWLTVEDSLYDKATIAANGTEVWHNASSQHGTLDHVDREWRYHDLDVTPHITDGTLRVTFGLTSDFGKELGGWTLDDVCIVGLVKNPRCGDGVLDEGEECDDGNTEDGDACDPGCGEQIVAGGGGCCDAGGSSPASALWALLLLVLRRRQR
jgi:cysteine-rich repeat protein